MNREILFRGKRIDNGEWIEGGYGKIPAPPVCIGEPGKPTVCIVAPDSGYMPDWGLPYKMAMYEVDPSTVGQYTGLTDKNGVKIFERDIVTGKFNGEKITGQIVYGSDAMFFIDRKGLYGIGLNNAADWLTVIGNIYDGKDGQHDEL